MKICPTINIVNQFCHVETELASYLADPDRSLTMLNKYPLVKATFMHSNAVLPSSAAVLRQFTVFSIGGQIEPAKRNRLHSKLEKLLLLKTNTEFMQ
jgi:hypothetical protein